MAPPANNSQSSVETQLAHQGERPVPVDLLVDLGGQGPILHLAHANGFPPGTYRPLASRLGDRYRVRALPLRPLWPGSDPESAPTWRPLSNDLIQGFDALGWRGVVGVGHSLGGVVTMWAAIRRPDLFRAVVLVDPVILPTRWLVGLRLQRAMGVAKRQPLVQGALRRRQSWTSRDACFEYLRRKDLFSTWSPESLLAYVEAGTRELVDGTAELLYPPAWEAHIFATVPTDIWRDVPLLDVPALIVRGETSETFLRESQEQMKRMLPRAQHAVLQNSGHLLPMERPEALGAMIQSFLDASAAKPT